MAEKKTTVNDGGELVHIHYSKGLVDRIRSGISDLVRRAFYYVPEEERIPVSVRRTLDGYKLDSVDYRRSNLPFQVQIDLVSKIQESAERILEENPDKTVAEGFFETRCFDPFGIIRLGRYLTK